MAKTTNIEQSALKLIEQNDVIIYTSQDGKQYLTTATDGKTYDVQYCSLEMILAVGYRVRGVRGVQFRQWAGRRTRIGEEVAHTQAT